mmetsp:Transcript_22189/g.54289  ORF Transcript_22189/g.54289 Transcript_22189/m.54289 type:complete len:410 (+) Transcript_22189:235-1464(+)
MYFDAAFPLGCSIHYPFYITNCVVHLIPVSNQSCPWSGIFLKGCYLLSSIFVSGTLAKHRGYTGNSKKEDGKHESPRFFVGTLKRRVQAFYPFEYAPAVKNIKSHVSCRIGGIRIFLLVFVVAPNRSGEDSRQLPLLLFIVQQPAGLTQHPHPRRFVRERQSQPALCVELVELDDSGPESDLPCLQQQTGKIHRRLCRGLAQRLSVRVALQRLIVEEAVEQVLDLGEPDAAPRQEQVGPGPVLRAVAPAPQSRREPDGELRGAVELLDPSPPVASMPREDPPRKPLRRPRLAISFLRALLHFHRPLRRFVPPVPLLRPPRARGRGLAGLVPLEPERFAHLRLSEPHHRRHVHVEGGVPVRGQGVQEPLRPELARGEYEADAVVAGLQPREHIEGLPHVPGPGPRLRVAG